jgi:TP901 family phage tail tape measure protein
MATNKTIKIGVEFDLKKDTLEQLKRELNTIQDKSLFSNATTELKQAGAAAEKLIDILNQSYDTKLNQLDMTKFTRGLSEAGLTANSLKSTLEATGNSQAFNLLASSVMSANIQLKQTSTLMDKMAITMANTIRFGISSSVFNNLTGAVQKAYNYVLDLDESLNSIRVVSKQNTSQMEAFAKSANSAAKALGATTLDYTDAALIYYQQGLDTDKVQQMTDITIKMANVTKDSAEDVSSYMTAIWNNFADGSETLEHYADVITALGAATASSSSEIAEGLEKFASVAETVGLSYDYATAALATVVAQTRQSADTVGTAFKTLFARIQDLELGETLDDGTTLGTYSQALEKVGISIKDENGELKDMNDILDEMGEKWKTLSSDQQTALAQAVAGTRQYTQLVALMANYDTFKDNLEVAANATGELNEQNEIYLESTEAHLNTLKASAQSLYSSLFDTKEINPMIDAITQVIEGITKMSDAFGGGLKSLAGFSAMFVNVFQKQINQSLTR